PWPTGDLLGHLGTSLAPPPGAAMSSALVLAVYVVTFAVGFPANVFTLAVLASKCRRPRPAPPGHGRPSLAALSTAELLLLNLTLADLLLLLFLPFKMAEAAAGMAWPLPAALCPVANFCFYSSM
ncbi:FFAR3 protein, partial [Passerina amoena]|nr:FFAR3 protein [Passerina amoena]